MAEDPWAQFQDAPKDDPWAQFDDAPTGSKKTNASWSGAAARGGEQVANALGAIVSETGRHIGGGKQFPKLMAKVAQYLHDPNYRSGMEDAANTEASLGDRASGVGRALVEGAPGLAMSGLAGMAFGPAGFIGSQAILNSGNAVRGVREADQVPEDQALAGPQLARVAGSTAINTALDAAGAGKALSPLSKGLGMEGVRSAIAETAKAGATGAVTNAGQAISDKMIIEGQLPTLGELEASAATGGVAGGGIRALRGVPEAATAIKFRGLADLPESSVINSAKALQKAQQGNPKADPVGGAAKTLDRHISNFSIDRDNRQLIADTGIKADLNLLTDSLKRGETMDPEVFSRVQGAVDGIGAADPLIQALTDRNTFNQIRTQYYGEGLSDTPIARAADPNQRGFSPARLADYHMMWKAMNGGLGVKDAVLAGGQAVLGGIPKIVDKLTGASDPTSVLIDRFAGREVPTGGGPAMPYESPVLAEKAKAKALKDQVSQIQDTFIGKLNSLDRLEKDNATKARSDASAARVKANKDIAAQKKYFSSRFDALAAFEDAQQRSNQERINSFEKLVGSIKDPFEPQYSRLGADLGFEANQPPNPQYGSSTPVNPKELAFNAQLLEKARRNGGSFDDLSSILGFDSQKPLQISDIPVGDPMALMLMEQVLGRKINPDQMRADYANEQALKAQGLDTSRLPTPEGPDGRLMAQIAAKSRPVPNVPQDLKLLPKPSAYPVPREPIVSPGSRIDAMIEGRVDTQQAPQRKPSSYLRAKATETPQEALVGKAPKAEGTPMGDAMREAPKPERIIRHKEGRWTFEIPESQITRGEENWKEGIRNKVIRRQNFINAVKEKISDKHHDAAEKLLDKFFEKGKGRDSAFADYKKFVERVTQSKERRKELIAMFEKRGTGLNSKREWNN